ncbi:hypothetical protein [Burkholderia ubonensis]|uniref:hypothetical protein n=1 Tax=Burkholderia ubonensis TaxID=101571 RepID=UPI0012F9FEB6|nr:hypothetical protein [Burkholderia ubonensis]
MSSSSNTFIQSSDSESESEDLTPSTMGVAAYLAALDEQSKKNSGRSLGGPRVTIYDQPWRPLGATLSRDVNGHNNDCVIAAFRTAKPGVNDVAVTSLVTSTEQGISRAASVYGMRKIAPAMLSSILPDTTTEMRKGGRRAFINAPALGGHGGRHYHAYTAIGVDKATGKIIAWDTDNDHADLKLVPIELIWLAYA